MRNNKNEFNLWGDWNVCTFELLWLFFGKEVVFSKTYPSFLTLKEGSTSHLGLLSSGKKRETALQCYICPTCPSPAGGSLILNQAFPLTIKGKDVAGSAIAPPEFWYRQRSLCPKGLPMSAYATELRLFVG